MYITPLTKPESSQLNPNRPWKTVEIYVCPSKHLLKANLQLSTSDHIVKNMKLIMTSFMFSLQCDVMGRGRKGALGCSLVGLVIAEHTYLSRVSQVKQNMAVINLWGDLVTTVLSLSSIVELVIFLY